MIARRLEETGRGSLVTDGINLTRTRRVARFLLLDGSRDRSGIGQLLQQSMNITQDPDFGDAAPSESKQGGPRILDRASGRRDPEDLATMSTAIRQRANDRSPSETISST